jgi:hypothetical protein
MEQSTLYPTRVSDKRNLPDHPPFRVIPPSKIRNTITGAISSPISIDRLDWAVLMLVWNPSDCKIKPTPIQQAAVNCKMATRTSALFARLPGNLTRPSRRSLKLLQRFKTNQTRMPVNRTNRIMPPMMLIVPKDHLIYFLIQVTRVKILQNL